MATALGQRPEQNKEFKKQALHVRRLVLTDPTSGGAGAYLEDDDSGNLKLVNAAGTSVTLAASELALLDGLTPASSWTPTQGGAGAYSLLVNRKTGIADNTATAIFTVTVPNGECNAAIFLDILAHLGAGTDLSESSRCATGCIVLARKTGADTVAAAATLTTAQIATTSGGGTLTLAYGVSSITGASSVAQTFTINVTLVVTGTITNHVAVVAARLLNSGASGVTMVAA